MVDWWGARYRVVVSDGGPGRFNRSRARNQAASGDWDVALFADADTIGNDQVNQAVGHALETGQLTYPYTRIVKLSRRGTRDYYRGETDPDVEQIQDGAPCGILAIRRDLFDRIGRWDEAFDGWGYEDMAFYYAAATLGGVHRIDGSILHLWHPPAAEKADAIRGRTVNRARAEKYKAAMWNPVAMTDLLEELACG